MRKSDIMKPNWNCEGVEFMQMSGYHLFIIDQKSTGFLNGFVFTRPPKCKRYKY